MASKKITFRSIQELEDPTLTKRLAEEEFMGDSPVDAFFGDDKKKSKALTSRRDFLKFLGFSTAAVTLAACEAPVIKTIPYVVQPHDIIPGVPNYYASTFFDGFDFANVLVKTREGRPIKIEPNPVAGNLGATIARAQGSLLALYDNDKVKQPKLDGDDATFDKVDDEIIKALDKAQGGGKKIVLLSHSMPSPTFKKLFTDFQGKYPAAELVTYDAYPYAAGLDAAEEVFGTRNLPVYDLANAELVVSFAADFLTDYNAGKLKASYAAARRPGEHMLRHIQVESNLSLTGSNSDTRYKQKPSQVYKTLAEVYKGMTGSTSDKIAANIVKELKAKGNKAVVFADGSKPAQVLAHLINQQLGSVAFTGKASYLKEYNGAAYQQFMQDLQAGNVGVLITNDINPIYSSNQGQKFQSNLKNVDFIVAISGKRNEMAQAAKVVIPAANWLESWGDITPETGVYTLMQPTIQKVFKSRQVEESLLVWLNGKGSPKNNYYDYLKANALSILGGVSFNQALYNSFNNVSFGNTLAYTGGDANAAIAAINAIKPSQMELFLYTKVGIGDGTQANNPWLQELPDPISRLSWDNYVTMSPKDAKKYGLRNKLNGRMQLDGLLVDLNANGVTIKGVPVFEQPGQAEGSIGLALGYGKVGEGKVAETGVNAYPFFDGSNLIVSDVRFNNTNNTHKFAGMQLQNTLMGRYEIAKEVPLDSFLHKDVKEWNAPIEMHTYGGSLPIDKVELWDNLDDTDGPHFNLSVDMNLCIGCGACVVACQVENNIPVVGKEEIRMSRDMYWLRIDRYYTAIEHVDQKDFVDKGLDIPSLYGLGHGENSGIVNTPADNPDVIFQPVMCQHCNHAPCETVCPVAATSHGKQGQNQMAYNRCIGTRYCANNCPYKVRRFNWFEYALNDKFDYNMNNDLGRMVLNPDVVVRSRGVMEKCSMCIQRTQAALLQAKKDGRVVEDAEFQTACSQACPTGAIQFGDMNDDKSHVRQLFGSKRRYYLLEEVGTKPNVFYHAKVRNRQENQVI